MVNIFDSKIIGSIVWHVIKENHSKVEVILLKHCVNNILISVFLNIVATGYDYAYGKLLFIVFDLIFLSDLLLVDGSQAMVDGKILNL